MLSLLSNCRKRKVEPSPETGRVYVPPVNNRDEIFTELYNTLPSSAFAVPVLSLVTDYVHGSTPVVVSLVVKETSLAHSWFRSLLYPLPLHRRTSATCIVRNMETGGEGSFDVEASVLTLEPFDDLTGLIYFHSLFGILVYSVYDGLEKQRIDCKSYDELGRSLKAIPRAVSINEAEGRSFLNANFSTRQVVPLSKLRGNFDVLAARDDPFRMVLHHAKWTTPYDWIVTSVPGSGKYMWEKYEHCWCKMNTSRRIPEFFGVKSKDGVSIMQLVQDPAKPIFKRWSLAMPIIPSSMSQIGFL